MTWWQGVKMILCRLHCSSTSQKLVNMSCILVIPQTARDSSKSSKAMAIPWPWRFTFHGFCDFPRAFHWPCQHCCEYSSVTRVANVSSNPTFYLWRCLFKDTKQEGGGGVHFHSNPIDGHLYPTANDLVFGIIAGAHS